MGLAVKIMLSVDDDSDSTHISGCGYSLPTAVAPATITAGSGANLGASTLSPATTSLTPPAAAGTHNQLLSAAAPQLFSVIIAGSSGGADGGGVYGEGTDPAGLEDGAVGGDIDFDDAENDVDNRSEYSDDNSTFSEMASTQAGGASPQGSPVPIDDHNTATSDTSGFDTRTGDSSTPSPSRKAGSLRQQQQKDFAVQQQQHLVELRTLQQSHQQEHRKSTPAITSQSSHNDQKHLLLVKGGRQHFVAQTRERGLLFGWGGNDFGQLGAGSRGGGGTPATSPLALSPLSLPYDAIAAAALQKYHKIHLIPSLLASLQLLHDNAVSRSYSAIRAVAPSSTTPMQFHMKLKQLLQGIPTGEFTISDPTPSAHLPYLLVSVLLAISPSDVAIEGFVCLPWSTVVTVSLRVKETRRVSYVEHASTVQQAAAAERSAAAAAAANAAVPKKKGAKAAVPSPVAGPVGGAKKASIAPPSLVTETTHTSTKVTVTVILGNTNNTATTQ